MKQRVSREQAVRAAEHPCQQRHGAHVAEGYFPADIAFVHQIGGADEQEDNRSLADTTANAANEKRFQRVIQLANGIVRLGELIGAVFLRMRQNILGCLEHRAHSAASRRS